MDVFHSFCDRVDDDVIDEVRHFPVPLSASMQLHFFTHWSEFRAMGKEMIESGIPFVKVMEIYKNWETSCKNIEIGDWFDGICKLVGEIDNLHF